MTWGFLASALFSRHLCSSITDVSLEGMAITANDAEAIAQVLAANDPLKHLFGRLRGDDVDHGIGANDGSTSAPDRCQPVRMTLKQGTAVTMQQMDPDENILDESDTWALKADVVGVKLVEDDGAQGGSEGGSASVSVLVPGYGLCSVRQDQLKPIPEDGECSMLASSSVTSLALDDVHDVYASGGLMRLLHLVGSSLTRLRVIVHPNLHLPMRFLLQYCPNLQSLIINQSEVDTNDFLRGYRASEMRISELSCRFNDLCMLSVELSDKSTRLAQTLKRLECYCHSFWDFDNENLLQSVAEMLDANHSLEYFSISVPRKHYGVEVDRIKSHHRAVLPVFGDSLPLQHRLAFLSVFGASRRVVERQSKRAKSETSSSPLMLVLANFPVDRHVVGIIFDFAAQCARRRVYVEPR